MPDMEFPAPDITIEALGELRIYFNNSREPVDRDEVVSTLKAPVHLRAPVEDGVEFLRRTYLRDCSAQEFGFKLNVILGVPSIIFDKPSIKFAPFAPRSTVGIEGSYVSELSPRQPMQMVGLHRAAVPHLQRAIFACAPYAPPVQDCCDLIFPFLAIETTLSQTHEEAMERNWHNGGAMLQGLRALHVKAKGPADAAWNFDMHCKALTIILSFDQVDIMAHWTRLNENHEVEYKCCFVENYPTKQPLIWPELVCVIRNAVKWKAGMEAIKENLSLVENSLHTSGATSESES